MGRIFGTHKLVMIGVFVGTAVIPGTGYCSGHVSRALINRLTGAASDGQLSIVEAILRNRISPKLLNGIDDYGHTALGDAVWWNHPAAVKYLILQGANVNGRDQHRNTPLHKAAMKGWVELVRLLIDRGADVRAKNADLQTPLHLAAYDGHTATAKLLLAAGANTMINAKDNQGRNALYLAVMSLQARMDMVRLLLDAHSDVNYPETSDHWTPLHFVAQRGDNGTARLLLDHSADIDARTDKGWTALWLAAYWGHKDTAYLLIEHGASPDIFTAVDLGDLAMVAKLLNARPALLEARDFYGATPLHEAAERGEKEIAEMLITSGARMNVKDYCGDTPLSAAISHEHPRVANVIRSHGGTQ
ncbi:MAG: ankyrin repeat domain-containing protein [Armatimonadetes bacterium]|nr:ankyrin repeat domain-containing protein [Armatimonadota bacterium]